MPHLDVSIRGDGAWDDLDAVIAAGNLINLMGAAAPPIKVAYLRHGMASGRGAVVLRLELPDGRVVVTETSLALFIQAADLMRAAELRGTGTGPGPGRDG